MSLGCRTLVYFVLKSDIMYNQYSVLARVRVGGCWVFSRFPQFYLFIYFFFGHFVLWRLFDGLYTWTSVVWEILRRPSRIPQNQNIYQASLSTHFTSYRLVGLTVVGHLMSFKIVTCSLIIRLHLCFYFWKKADVFSKYSSFIWKQQTLIFQWTCSMDCHGCCCYNQRHIIEDKRIITKRLAIK